MKNMGAGSSDDVVVREKGVQANGAGQVFGSCEFGDLGGDRMEFDVDFVVKVPKAKYDAAYD